MYSTSGRNSAVYHFHRQVFIYFVPAVQLPSVWCTAESQLHDVSYTEEFLVEQLKAAAALKETIL